MNWMRRNCVMAFLLPTIFYGCFNTTAATEEAGPTEEDLAYQKVWDRVKEQFELPANEAAQRKKFDKAVKLYEAAAAQWQAENFPSEYVQEGRYSQIVSNFLAAGELNEQRKEFARAADDYLECEKIARVSSRRRTYMALVGRAYREGKDFAKAEETYKSLIKNGFSGGAYGTDPHISLAQVYEDEGHLDLAEKTLSEFLNESIKNCVPLDTRAARIAFRDMYMRSGRTSDTEKMDQALKDKHCPVCHSDSIVLPIGYGLSNGPTDGTMHLGGCVFSNNSPQWWCKQDKIAF